MFSEVVIAGTLLVNACAVLNFRLTKSQSSYPTFAVEGEPRSAGDRVREFLLSLQYFRVFIALWNVFIVFLMLIFFSH
uniref:Small integral membrane protein 7 n=1 Tax=Plectus sambesii TaxID=2011161 RepID=A0A914WUT4_9BILA